MHTKYAIAQPRPRMGPLCVVGSEEAGGRGI